MAASTSNRGIENWKLSFRHIKTECILTGACVFSEKIFVAVYPKYSKKYSIDILCSFAKSQVCYVGSKRPHFVVEFALPISGSFIANFGLGTIIIISLFSSSRSDIKAAISPRKTHHWIFLSVQCLIHLSKNTSSSF